MIKKIKRRATLFKIWKLHETQTSVSIKIDLGEGGGIQLRLFFYVLSEPNLCYYSIFLKDWTTYKLKIVTIWPHREKVSWVLSGEWPSLLQSGAGHKEVHRPGYCLILNLENCNHSFQNIYWASTTRWSLGKVCEIRAQQDIVAALKELAV